MCTRGAFDAGADTCAPESVCSSGHACGPAQRCDCGCCRDIPPPESLLASQYSPVSPSGHEFLTLQSAVETRRVDSTFPGDVAAESISKTGRCDGHCAHRSGSFRVWSAILGARWADLMGFRAGPFFPAQQRCLLAVAQDNDDVQYDHALRRSSDEGPEGGLRAMAGIRERLRERFLTAVQSEDGLVAVADGGAQQDHYRAHRAFFLFGRALHIVQDSFSPFHGERRAPEHAAWVQVSSYVCTRRSPPHPHVTPGIGDLFSFDAGNGDIIWRQGCKDCGDPKFLKPEYGAAVLASRDLWLAFWRARRASSDDRLRVAAAGIDAFLERWLKLPRAVPAHDGDPTCTTTPSALLASRRAACLRALGQAPSVVDAPFDWDVRTFDAIP